MLKPARSTRKHSKNGKFETTSPITLQKSSGKYDASAKEVADTYHKECVDGDPPREPRAHELKEQLLRRFALEKQKTT